MCIEVCSIGRDLVLCKSIYSFIKLILQISPPLSSLTEADASESSESSEYETPISVSKPKPLQARRSILDNLDECHNKDDVDTPPPPKRQKREHMVSQHWH